MHDLAALFAEHHAATLRLAYLLTGDAAQAEDVVAEVFARLARSLPVMDHPAAYLRRAVSNEVTSSWRRLARDRARAERIGAESVPLPDPAERSAEAHAMWDALATLPPRQRTVLVLRYYEDLSERDIAAAMGISVGTVKSTAARALAALRTRVDAAPVAAAVRTEDRIPCAA